MLPTYLIPIVAKKVCRRDCKKKRRITPSLFAAIFKLALLVSRSRLVVGSQGLEGRRKTSAIGKITSCSLLLKRHASLPLIVGIGSRSEAPSLRISLAFVQHNDVLGIPSALSACVFKNRRLIFCRAYSVTRTRITNLVPIARSILFRHISILEIDPGSCEKPSKRRVLTIMRKIMLVKALADLVYVRVKMSFLFHNFNYYGYGE